MKKLIKNLLNKKANRKQVFKNFHDTMKESQCIISDMQKDVDILIELNKEMQGLNKRNIEICEEFIAYLDKSIAKSEGDLI